MKRAWLLLLLLCGSLPALRAQPAARPDARRLAALPVLQNGRVKPLDTVGRSALLMLRGKQTVRDGERSLSASEWVLDLMFDSEAADKYPVFMINDADVLAMLGKRPDEGRFYAMTDLTPHLAEIEQQSDKASRIETPRRDRFQRAIASLGDRITAYQRLKNALQVEGTQDFQAELVAYAKALPEGREALRLRQEGKPFEAKAIEQLGPFIERYRFIAEAASLHAIPPSKGSDGQWSTVGAALLDAGRTGRSHPSIGPLARASSAWKKGDRAAFEAAAADLVAITEAVLPESAAKARLEVLFNRIQPFYVGILLYTLVALLYFASWLGRTEPLQRAAWWLLLGTFVLHSAGMFIRMHLEGRPPVTNLYSSAVFVGWVAVLLALPFERHSRRGFAALGGAIVGATTLIVAHNLTGGGDTMEMMRAVLDSNFWLATHVTTITIGYGATFLAGLLAHIYLLRRIFSRAMTTAEADTLVRSTYGVICFALFFSFVGTVLGGIWADQSWGRFWGWDPKENGALLIVLWNAVILHARWGGYIRERGIMAMAIGGNIITALSWFGVNMLGVGLHSYGFMDQAFWALAAFTLVEAAVIALALSPQRWWRSRLA